MPKTFVTFVLLTASLFSFGATRTLNTQLSEKEKAELTARLNAFHQKTKVQNPMDMRIGKMDVLSEEWTEPNPLLKQTMPHTDPLLQSAGKKLMPQFLKSRCEQIFKKKYPFLECQTKEAWNFVATDETESENSFEGLLKTWMPTEAIVRNLTQIPVQAEIAQTVWSGDYWRMRWGLTSYRYSDPRSFATYSEAVDSYHQPGEWLSATASHTTAELSNIAVKWSPAEKYDLLAGDENMTLTQQQKQEGSYNLGEDGNVESWFGICHGWAPASFMVPSPNFPVHAISARGADVVWYPDDVRAMATLAWANGNFQTNFIGGRCNQKQPERYPNGRLSQPECFDNNPVSFHLALGNMIGIQKTPVIMDAAFDYQVWNQPILAYEFEYYNPLDLQQKGKDWQKYVVTYNEAFKSNDRFQQPLTRGKKQSNGKYDDSRITGVVGVTATVIYLAETTATHTTTPSRNNTVRVTYTYDLEFESQNGTLIPTGGEWHENRHPDFLWVPEKGSIAKLNYDATALNVDLLRKPEPLTTTTATQASSSGYPLCQVLEKVVRSANPQGSYQCTH